MQGKGSEGSGEDGKKEGKFEVNTNLILINVIVGLAAIWFFSSANSSSSQSEMTITDFIRQYMSTRQVRIEMSNIFEFYS